MRLIDADAFVKYLENEIRLMEEDGANPYAVMIASGAINDVGRQPTIEPKRGEWRYVGNSIELMWECPQCGYKVFGFERALPNFCGNCGCDMRKEGK